MKRFFSWFDWGWFKITCILILASFIILLLLFTSFNIQDGCAPLAITNEGILNTINEMSSASYGITFEETDDPELFKNTLLIYGCWDNNYNWAGYTEAFVENANAICSGWPFFYCKEKNIAICVLKGNVDISNELPPDNETETIKILIINREISYGEPTGPALHILAEEASYLINLYISESG